MNTDDLVSFFTGNIDDLFKASDEELKKSSKIVFCLDASSSMGKQLIDKSSRRNTLVACTESLIRVLDDVRETEGLNVDYDVIAFTGGAYLLDKDNWKNEYYAHTGGTNIYNPVEMAIRILKDDGLDGNKIIIMVTDGDVSPDQIEAIKGMIMMNSCDIKAMILGIGADTNGHFTKKVCGDNNILCSDHAEEILMEAIQTTLED